MRRLALAALLVALAAPIAALGQALDGKWWKRPLIAERIGLTEEQSDEIEKVFVEARPKLIDLKADLEKKQFALQQAMEGKSVDREDVEDKIDAVEKARAELQKTRALMVLDMKRILKPEQWERLKRMQEESIQRRRRMREQGGRSRGNPGRFDRPSRRQSPRDPA